jgi:hypothetical protein
MGGNAYHDLVRTVLTRCADVQGRITERQLPLAERSHPGISRFYAELETKPATFLQLLWAYEGARMTRARPRKRRSR